MLRLKTFEYRISRLKVLIKRLLGNDIRTAGHIRLRSGARLNAKPGTIIVGKKCRFDQYTMVLAYGGTIKLGDNVSLNPFSIIYGQGGVEIGSDTRIAAHVVIVASDHRFDSPDLSIREQGLRRKGIRVGRDVWIGAGAKILDGANIGDGCVIGANAVVKGTLEPNGLYVGVPARRIKERVQSASDPT